MRVWPVVPLEPDAVTGGDAGMALGVCGVEMADDVRGVVLVGGDEARVGGCVCPSNHGRDTGLVRVLEDVVAFVGGAVNDNALDESVGGDGGSGSEDREDGGVGVRRHLRG